ncbi:MAG: zinc-ribbon domain-containing protein [Coriobacteriales bacterium]|jgi:DNA-directed RNA polymerase subunit RPC12/RpoP|nr:zinc-ribbon domain-containing protein [Coriobacteriales bacterium]
MCFRPAAITTEITCPKCGHKNPPTATVCENCGATAEEIMASMGSAPGMPAPPGAPGMPAPPGAPGVPRPPGAPGAPGVPKAPPAPPKPPGQ